MNPELVGVIGIIIMVVLMFLGMPIAFSMALIGFIGFTYLTSLSGSLFLLSNGFYFQFTSYYFRIKLQTSLNFFYFYPSKSVKLSIISLGKSSFLPIIFSGFVTCKQTYSYQNGHIHPHKLMKNK